MADIKVIAKELVSLTVREANELATVLKDECGTEPVATAVAVAGPTVAAAGGAAEEKSDFDAVLADAGANKPKVVKAVKETCGLGLKEARDLIGGVPSTLEESMAKTEAENLKAVIEAEGTKVELE